METGSGRTGIPSPEEAKANLLEAVELFLETADQSEIEERLHSEVYVTQLQVAV